jgi:hypothetical protein
MKKAMTTLLPSPFSFSFFATECRRQRFFFCFLVHCATLSAHLFFYFFCGSAILKKKKTIVSITFFDGFAAKKWQPSPFFGGFDVKKVTIAMSSPSSMVAVVFYFFCCSFGLVH